MSERRRPACRVAIDTVAEVCAFVDGLDPTHAGELLVATTASSGAVFIERGRICWAAAEGLARRLTELLVVRAGIDAMTMELLYRRCKADQVPLGEYLVGRGIVEAAALRAALAQHTIESLVLLTGPGRSAEWYPRRHGGYSARFTFGTAEVLARASAFEDAATASVAEAEISALFRDDEWAAAFVPSPLRAMPAPIALWGDGPPTAGALAQMAKWAVSALDLARAFDGNNPLIAVRLPMQRGSRHGWSSRSGTSASSSPVRPARSLRPAFCTGARGSREVEMAIFDPHEERLCVRVVYDGLAGAGKTTNLRQLSSLFAVERATEVHSPSELDGRTLFFDWMQIHAGVVSGIPLICQIISVPGQVVLTPRRRHLLATADVIVYVCDSSRMSVARAREGLAIVDAVACERCVDIPIVFQANKQDQVDALDCTKVLDELGREGAPIVDAIATEGIGVVDTFVMAIRTLARSMQERVDRGDLRLEVRRAETREGALARVAKQAIDPEWAAEMLLEEASAAFLLRNLERKVLPPANGEHDPTLPHPDVPTGFIWPAHTGRATLGSLAKIGALAATPRLDPSGSVIHVANGYVMQTHRRHRFDDAEAARQALVRTARQRTQLEQLLVPDTVLVAQPAGDGAWWIWTVMRHARTLDAALAEGTRVRELLAAYGVALAEAVRPSLRHGLGLDFHARSFDADGATLRYRGDLLPTPPRDLAAAIVDAITALGRDGSETEIVLAAFEREMQKGHGGVLEPAGSAADRVQAMLARAGAGP